MEKNIIILMIDNQTVDFLIKKYLKFLRSFNISTKVISVEEDYIINLKYEETIDSEVLVYFEPYNFCSICTSNYRNFKNNIQMFPGTTKIVRLKLNES